MKHVLNLLAGIAATGLALAPAAALADQDGDIHVRLEGIQEVPSVITGASGRFTAKIEADAIHWELSYQGLEGLPVTQAHIHVGQRHTNGGIVVFLCSNLPDPPAGTQACPAPPATLRGTATAASVLPQLAQGVAPMDFPAVLQAIKKGAAYVNVHTMVSPGGEIRAQLHGDHD
jgi:hypothetical protein